MHSGSRLNIEAMKHRLMYKFQISTIVYILKNKRLTFKMYIHFAYMFV